MINERITHRALRFMQLVLSWVTEFEGRVDRPPTSTRSDMRGRRRTPLLGRRFASSEWVAQTWDLRNQERSESEYAARRPSRQARVLARKECGGYDSVPPAPTTARACAARAG